MISRCGQRDKEERTPPKPEIILDGVDPLERQRAKDDLRVILCRPESARLRAFIVTADLPTSLRRLRGVKIIDPFSTNEWKGLIGLGKTFVVRVGVIRRRIEYLVAFNSEVSPDAYEDWAPSEGLSRRFFLEHELTHVRTMSVQVDTKGAAALMQLLLSRRRAHAIFFNGRRGVVGV